jgi:hypothetical protein
LVEMKLPVQTITAALLIALPGLPPLPSPVLLTQLPSSSDSQSTLFFNAPPPPPNLGEPGRRSDAGSRGCETMQPPTSAVERPLTALVPLSETGIAATVFGATAVDRPTFWFYVSQRPPFNATFVLNDQDGNLVYESNVTLPDRPGVIRLDLPPTAAPLEIGKPYHWYFKVYCRSSSPPDFFIDGWVQRNAIDADLSRQIEAATLQQRIRLYATNGFWYDALTAAAELRRSDPNPSEWANLLRSIGLNDFASEAIVDCCQLGN